MLEQINSLLKLDFFNIISTIFVIMSGIIAVHSIIGKISVIIGKPVKWVTQRQADHDLIMTNKREIDKLKNKHENDTKKYVVSHRELIDKVEILKELLLDKQISDYRWEIINVADKISAGKIVSKECLRHAITTHDKYEKIIKEYNIINGEVDVSIAVIKGEYAKFLSDEK